MLNDFERRRGTKWLRGSRDDDERPAEAGRETPKFRPNTFLFQVKFWRRRVMKDLAAEAERNFDDLTRIALFVVVFLMMKDQIYKQFGDRESWSCDWPRAHSIVAFHQVSPHLRENWKTFCVRCEINFFHIKNFSWFCFLYFKGGFCLLLFLSTNDDRGRSNERHETKDLTLAIDEKLQGRKKQQVRT